MKDAGRNLRITISATKHVYLSAFVVSSENGDPLRIADF